MNLRELSIAIFAFADLHCYELVSKSNLHSNGGSLLALLQLSLSEQLTVEFKLAKFAVIANLGQRYGILDHGYS
ncbi:hypothetical protein Pla108_02530 [Botrimarina colliarenosi]|uniref:Uncharacterized protein n=1 Tax=Botrimarina colliarenosi TaxID=2528001 RepID=A0A5C6AJ96_9BACT|nr:hypothetical protein Pla108_02530 [Botrimarina colliarenosi]